MFDNPNTSAVANHHFLSGRDVGTATAEKKRYGDEGAEARSFCVPPSSPSVNSSENA